MILTASMICQKKDKIRLRLKWLICWVNKTTGSIIGPAETNSVIGFKPTRRLIRTDAYIPISLTSTVKDAAHVLNVLAGCSELDPMTWNIPFDPMPDFTTFCNGTSLGGMTISIPRSAFSGDIAIPIMASFESVMEILRSAGANFIDNTDFEAAEEFRKLDRQVQSFVQTAKFKPI